MVLGSPFPHHGPLAPDQVHGRDDLVADLTERLSGHRPTVVVAPRRYGKTSLIGRVTAGLADTVTVVAVDLYEVRSWSDLAARLADGVSAVGRPHRGELDRYAASLDINLGIIRTSISRPARGEADASAESLVDLIVAHGQQRPTVIVFDEFSSIAHIKGAAGMLRTRLQHHYQQIGLLFAGSEPSTMRMLFEDNDQPFYAQADLVDIGPLTLSAFTDIVATGFEGDPPSGLAGRIHALTGGHPQRSMQLADAAWVETREGSREPWPDALAQVRRQTASGHETRFSAASAADQAVLRLIAVGSPLFGTAARSLELAKSSAQYARTRLIAEGHLVDRDGDLTIVDPLYADWIRHRFPS